MQDKMETLKKFVQSNQEDFYRMAYSYTKNVDAALDVVQESIVKSIDKIDSLKNIEYLKTWFYRILINESISYLRSNKRLVLIDDFPKEYEAQDDHSDDVAQSIDMYNAVQALEPKIKTVITLRFFNDMKLEEIARITGDNLSTVKSRLYKGLKMLKIGLTGSECNEGA